MTAIFKYDLAVEEQQFIEMPKDARILCVQLQFEQVKLWVRVEKNHALIKRKIIMIGTGWDFEDREVPQSTYIGTVQTAGGSYVWHFYDGGEVEN